MGKHEDVTKLKARADEWADEFLSKLSLPSDSGAVALARDSLRVGWMAGYNTAIQDVVVIRSAAGAVKH